MFTPATGSSARWTQLSCGHSGIRHSFETASSSDQGLVTLHTHMNHAGSCTWIVAPKHRELEAALLSTQQMLSKKLLQYSLHNLLTAGRNEECSLESLGSSHISQESKLAVGRVGELAKGHPCCVPPPSIMSSYLFLAGREMQSFQCLRAFSYFSNP